MSENPGGRSRTTWSLGFPLQVHCRNFRISRTGECSGHLGRWWICCVPLVSCVSRLQIQPFRNQPKHQNCTFKIDLQLIENSFGINMDREFLEWNTMKPQIHFRIHHIRRRPVYYPPPVVPPPSLTCVFAIHGSDLTDLTWGIQMRSKMLERCGNVVFKTKKSPWLFWVFWGLESVFYNGTNVTDQVEDLVYPESGQQDMTEIHLTSIKAAVIVLDRFVLCGEKALRTFFWMRILLIAPGQTPPSCKSSWWTFPLQPWWFGSKPWSSIVCISQDEG